MPFLQQNQRKALIGRNLALLEVQDQICRKSLYHLIERCKMYYICFDCGKKVEDEYTRVKIRCPYCGGKILYKDRRTVVKVKAR